MKMIKEKVKKEDGRFLIYYTFEEDQNNEKEKGDKNV